ncbi:MAG: hypothetical protein R3B47_19105 [Bacteroidia bacterium]
MNNHHLNILLLFLLLLAACGQPKPNDQSIFLLGKPVVIAEDGPAIFQYWDVKNEPVLWEKAEEGIHHLALYRDSLRLVLGEVLFEKAVEKERSQQFSGEPPSKEEPGYKTNAYLVHAGKLGHIRPINALEAQILNYQIGRYPMLGHPTEFHGFILKQDSLDLIRVYFASSDTPWPPKEGIIRDSLERDLSLGWTLYRHLHNHYEPDSNNYIGVLAPSMADAHYYKMLSENYNIDKTLITNGFYTVEMDNTEFGQFESH